MSERVREREKSKIHLSKRSVAHTVIGYYTRYSMKRMEKMFIERGLENWETYYVQNIVVGRKPTVGKIR